MRMVAPIWRAKALAMLLALAAGCDWIPVRRRLDPSLYPVPVRANATYLRGDRGPDDAGPDDASRPDDRTDADRLADRRDLPPLPVLEPVSPEEALAPPAPTPMLDAALVRANAVRSVVFEPGVGHPAAGPIAPVEGGVTPADSPVPFAPETPEHGGPMQGPEASPVDIPPIPPEAIESEPFEPGTGPTASEPIELPPLEPIQTETDADPADTAASASGESPSSSPDDDARAIPPDDDWRAGLEDLLDLAEEAEAQGDGSAEVWAARKRVLDWVAEAEGEVDDATLWQTVMVMLADPEPDLAEAPAGGSIEAQPIPTPTPDAPDAGPPGLDPQPTLRVARVAFCREVFGFGRVDPIVAGACRAGQDLIVYCELEGVRYEAEGDAQAARLWTALEIVPEAGGQALWREVRPLEDCCARARLDFFVGYGLTLPASLPPGRYRFRVSQEDLNSGAGAVGELPFEIVREAD
ncbi:hypothetical protein [Tautonia plasticadhaerens]|uniref:Uncharacterized protein n=1 Tax=Tautonia plasticadhaerens TaxID=2527974 RepID=A0A518HAV5_9BACT|nr:hypothetical protein [Tautonia plasticadhaerens]QDV37995.1 hypothetical protein ElP_59420 [Tautonia plasticadhaerens]